MRRRTVIAALGCMGLARPLSAQPVCCTLVGLLGPNPNVFAAFDMDGYWRSLGWEAERNFRVLARWSDGKNDALPRLAAELVGKRVEVLLAAGDQAVRAAQGSTRSIPIIGWCDDMVGSRLVASMAHPGGNTTGISILASELDVKRLQLLHETVPTAKRIGVLSDPTTVSTAPQLEAAARTLSIQLLTAAAADGGQVRLALGELAAARVDAVNVLASPILDEHRGLIVDLLNQYRLPAMFQWPESADTGGFAGYGPSLAEVLRAGVKLADRTLRGTRPGDIPVHQPTDFRLTINLRVGNALGLALPPEVLARADHLIE